MTQPKHTPESELLADAILKAAGSGLKYYSMPKTRGAIFAAAQQGIDAAIDQAADGKHASQIQAQRNAPLDALQAVLPYAERELESLDECQRRDGGLEDEVAECAAAVEQAQRVLEAARGKP